MNNSPFSQHGLPDVFRRDTPLDLALINYNKEIVEILLLTGASCKSATADLENFQAAKAKRERKEFGKGLEEILKTTKISKRIFKYFVKEQNWEVQNEREIKEQMTDGRIPIGFPNRALWSAAHEELNELPNKMKEKEERVAIGQKEEKRIAEKIQKLQVKLKKLSEENKSLQSEIAPWEDFRDKQLTPLMKKSGSFATVERKLNQSLNAHFVNSSVEDLISLDQAKKEMADSPPKLSIVFNCAGLSPESIKKLCYVDGTEFSQSEISELVNSHQLPFQEKLKLKELQIMFEEGRVPADIADHEENCALCSAATPEEVKYLLEEHGKVFDFLSLEKYEMSGKMFLALTPKDIREYFLASKLSPKQLIATMAYIKKQHVPGQFTKKSEDEPPLKKQKR